MQEKKINQSPEVNKKSVSIGALLVNARNQAALSQLNVSEQLNLPLHTIKALEEDDFNQLPEATYIRGYLRNYARVVGVSPEGLIKAFDEQHYQEPEVISNTRSRQSYDPTILWSTAAVFSVLVGLVITWWVESNPTDLKPADTLLSNQQVLERSDNKQEIVAHNSQTQSLEVVNEVEAIQDEIPAINEEITPDQQQAMEVESQNPTLVTLNEGAPTLTVTYVEKSWTEITDADSNTLMQGLIEPGVVRNLSGKPPFEVFLGNSPGVVIEVNGLYFDHSQYSRSNNTARFQVSSGSLN